MAVRARTASLTRSHSTPQMDPLPSVLFFCGSVDDKSVFVALLCAIADKAILHGESNFYTDNKTCSAKNHM